MRRQQPCKQDDGEQYCYHDDHSAAPGAERFPPGETPFGIGPADGGGVGAVFVVHASKCKASPPRASGAAGATAAARSVAYTKKWGSTDRPAAPRRRQSKVARPGCRSVPAGGKEGQKR